MENQEKYNLNVFCKNCDFEGNVEIPKGTTYENHKCTKCGVANLVKKMQPVRIIPHIEDYR